MAKQRYSRCHKALIAVLEETREARGLSQRAVSEQLRRPVNFVHRIESGERMLSVCEFIELAQILGADPAQLVRRVAEKS